MKTGAPSDSFIIAPLRQPNTVSVLYVNEEIDFLGVSNHPWEIPLFLSTRHLHTLHALHLRCLPVVRSAVFVCLFVFVPPPFFAN